MKDLNKLAGQTLIYGLGTMLPRFLNYALLTPFYAAIFKPAEYGVVTELYAYIAFLLVFLTYGMETAFFRFAQKSDNPEKVYSTSIISLILTTGIFLIAFNVFIEPISVLMRYENSKTFLVIFSFIVALDALTAIPFARLRRENKPLKFSLLKLINVLVIISLALFFYLPEAAPAMYEKGNRIVTKLYNPDFGVGYVFVSNLAGSLVVFLILLPRIIKIRSRFSLQVWKNMIVYAFPLLISGMAGIINDAVDKVLVRRLIQSDDPLYEVGVYGAGYKIAVLMALFIQMYRFAMEPFFFEKLSGKDAKYTYATAMKYFVIYALMLFLGLNLYISVIQLILPGDYRESMFIVPVVSMGFLLYGIFVNLSIWYKANDITKYGAYLTFLGALITIVINVLFIPGFGYRASAWAHVACYGVMVIGSYLLSRKHYPINYETGKILSYIAIAVLIVIIASKINYGSIISEIGINTFLLILFIAFTEIRDKSITQFFKTGI